jgi:hypothetical protein
MAEPEKVQAHQGNELSEVLSRTVCSLRSQHSTRYRRLLLPERN